MSTVAPNQTLPAEVFDVFHEGIIFSNRNACDMSELYKKEQTAVMYEKAEMIAFVLQKLRAGKPDEITTSDLPHHLLDTERLIAATRHSLVLARQLNKAYEKFQVEKIRSLLKGTKLSFTLMDFAPGPVGIFGYYSKIPGNEKGLAVYNFTEIPRSIDGVFIDATHRGIVTLASPDSPTGYYSIETMNAKSAPPTQNVNMKLLDD